MSDATSAAAERGGQSLDQLIDALADCAAASDADLGRSALALLGSAPRTVLRLDEHARRWWFYAPSSPFIGQGAQRLAGDQAGPIALAITSLHGDGRVRERAVKAILADPSPELMPFLVLRTSDWVRQVRNRARAGLALLLAEDPATYLPTVLPITLLIAVRDRGGFAHTQALAAIITAPDQVLGALAGSPDRRIRRFVFDTRLAQRRLPFADLVITATTDPDVRIRSRAAEAACREAVWTRRIEPLRRLGRHHRPEVRAVALTGLSRLGHDAEVTAHLDDDNGLIRALARQCAHQVGTDPLAAYRASVTGHAPTPGAIAGLAEIGNPADASLLHPLLAHPQAKIRAATIRGLVRLDTITPDDLIPLLHDPSPSVVREATTALRPSHRRLPDQLAWDLLADPRTACRRAGYRLLRPRDSYSWLRAALLLATDPDPDLARHARADATRMTRDATRPAWRSSPPPILSVTPTRHAELVRLAHHAAPVLGDDTTGLLTTWLAETEPSDTLPTSDPC